MPRLTRWATLVCVGLIAWCWPRLSLAASPLECVTAEAISELEPDERKLLRQMCEEGSSASAQLVAKNRGTLTAALRLEGWKAAFAARTIAKVKPPPVDESKRQQNMEQWVEGLLGQTRKQGGRDVPTCKSFHGLVTASLRDLEKGRNPIPTSLADLGADQACVPTAQQPQLAELSKDWRLLTIPKRSKDELEVWIVDLHGLEVYRANPISYDDNNELAWLLLLPKDRMVTVSLKQHELDTPWVSTQRLVDIDFTLPRRRGECLVIEVGTDPGSDWSVVIGGAPAALELVPTENEDEATRRAILTVPNDAPGEESVHSGRPRARELVFVSTQEGADPWISSLAQERAQDHGRCRSVAYDLTGLHSSRERIGVAQVAVDQQCRDRGIVPSRIRTYIEGYTERAGKKLIPLDAWAEVMEIFRDLESRLGSQRSAEKGADRGDLDDREQMIVLASELRRKGVNSLLYFDVRCPGPSSEVTVIGTKVALDKFVGRANSRVTGVNTDELLDVRSQDSQPQELREAMEVVLGDLLQRPHVRFVNPPHRVDRGQRTTLRAVGVDPRPGASMSMEVDVWSLGGTNTAAACAQVKEFNDLSSFTKIEDIRALAAPTGQPPVLALRADTAHLEVELGRLKEGTYVAIATAASLHKHARADSQVGYALCFEVEDREFEITVDMGGLKQWTLPRSAPVSTRFSFFRVAGGVRYTAWEYFEFGGRIGYELVEYSTEVVPKWDNIGSAGITDDGRTPLDWRRHGLLIGPFVGLRVPFGRWPWELCRKTSDRLCSYVKNRRSANPELAAFFVNARVMINLGFASIDNLPADLVSAGASSTVVPDFDLGFTTGFRIRPRRTVTFGIFAGLLLTDIANANTDKASENDFWTNDWGIRGLVGLELGWGLSSR